MSEANTINLTVSDYCLDLLKILKTEQGCKNRSETIEWLVLCKFHNVADARALLGQRSKRGRRWPVVIPDDAVLPPEG